MQLLTALTLLSACNPTAGDADIAPAEDGGWERRRHASLDDLTCTLPRRSAKSLTKESFEAEFRHKRPVVVSAGLIAGWRAQTAWQKDAMLEQYGNATAKMGSSAELVFSAGDDSVLPGEFAGMTAVPLLIEALMSVPGWACQCCCRRRWSAWPVTPACSCSTTSG
jgi:hypothetical protein